MSIFDTDIYSTNLWCCCDFYVEFYDLCLYENKVSTIPWAYLHFIVCCTCVGLNNHYTAKYLRRSVRSLIAYDIQFAPVIFGIVL